MARISMDGSDEKAGNPSPETGARLPGRRRLTAFFLLALMASFAPWPTLAKAGPAWGIGVAFVGFFSFLAVTWKHGSGPVWVDLIEVIVLLSSVAAVGVALYRLLRFYFS